MNGLIDAVKAQEALNNIQDEIKARLDGQGAQEDAEVLDQGLEEDPRPEIGKLQFYIAII